MLSPVEDADRRYRSVIALRNDGEHGYPLGDVSGHACHGRRRRAGVAGQGRAPSAGTGDEHAARARVVRHAEGYVRCHRAHPLVLADRYDGNGWGIDTGGETGATGAMSAQGKGWSLFDKRKAGGPGVWITDQGFGFWPGGRRLLTARGQDVAAARRSLRTRDHRRPSRISGLRSGVLRRSPRSCRTVREFVFEGSTDGCA